MRCGQSRPPLYYTYSTRLDCIYIVVRSGLNYSSSVLCRALLLLNFLPGPGEKVRRCPPVRRKLTVVCSAVRILYSPAHHQSGLDSRALSETRRRHSISSILPQTRNVRAVNRRSRLQSLRADTTVLSSVDQTVQLTLTFSLLSGCQNVKSRRSHSVLKF